ncbi:MAG TPA: hypothetical protein VJL28_03535 [Gemmatimonadaceae bacterium]|nr:hypothetical protein [Gemmatimonadaceae bacterium]
MALMEMIAFRTSKEERKALEKAAKASGHKLGSWCRTVALMMAAKKLRFVQQLEINGKIQ